MFRDLFESDICFVDVADIDKEFVLVDLLILLLVDLLQMLVIVMADCGKDFVIIGLLGMGKSQMIGNLIVYMMGKGKCVLFVFEKIVVLEVVYCCLRDIGLGYFCFELYFNKVKKVDVLVQFCFFWNSFL